MKNIHIKLISYLISNPHPSLNDLRDYLNVTTRSITNYINEINHIVPDTIKNRKFGYEISTEKARKILNYYQNRIPQSQSERVFYIINYLTNHNPYNIYDLADNLFVSYSTIKNDLKRVKMVLDEYNLLLEIKNNNLKILGNENNKRKLISNILLKVLSSNWLSINKLFNNDKYDYTRQLIFSILQSNNYSVNNYTLNELTLYLLVTINRIKNGYPNNTITQNKKNTITQKIEYQISRKIVLNLEEKFSLKFTRADIEEFALLLISRTLYLDYNNINEENIENFIGKKCMNIVTEMISKLNLAYNLKTKNPDSFIRLAIHIKNLLVRCQTNYFQKNLLVYNIQRNCPLIYETSIKLVQIITDNTGYKIPEDEIAFLAFHIGSIIEDQLKIESKLHVVIYYPIYYPLNKKIEQVIMDEFQEQIVITNIVYQKEKLERDNCDFIIAVCNNYDELFGYTNIPCVFITPLPSTEDIKKISNLILDLNHNKKQQSFAKSIRKLFNYRLFDFDKELVKVDKNMVIHQMSTKLINLGYAKKNFEQEVIKRELIMSTSYNNFAIPHALKLSASKSCIYVKTITKGLQWGNNKVNIIFLFCFSENDRILFSNTFDSLVKILYNEKNIKKLIKVSSYTDFIEELIKMYK